MTRIMTNISAINGQRNLAKTGLRMGKTLERLASGYRINRAADDAAGLAISEKMRAQSRGNKQALRFRDSQARVADSVFLDNLYAVHAFRCELEFTGNTLEGNALGGFFAKESRVTFVGSRLRANRDGVRMRDPGSRATIRGNRLEDSAEVALSLSGVKGVVEGNRLTGAGLDLVWVGKVLGCC